MSVIDINEQKASFRYYWNCSDEIAATMVAAGFTSLPGAHWARCRHCLMDYMGTANTIIQAHKDDLTACRNITNHNPTPSLTQLHPNNTTHYIQNEISVTLTQQNLSLTNSESPPPQPPPNFLNKNHFQSIYNRLRTYRLAPPSLSRNEEIFALSGFYYISTIKAIRCYSCKMTSVRWSEMEDPWEIHALSSPLCEFLIEKKGHEFIARTRRFNEMVEVLRRQLVELEQKLDKLPFKKCLPNNCSVCLDQPSNTVVIPCGHICICSTCVPHNTSLKKGCPVCRATVSSICRVFIS